MVLDVLVSLGLLLKEADRYQITDPARRTVDGFPAGTMARRFPRGAVGLARAKTLVAFIETLR